MDKTEELFMETNQGNIPIEPETVKKFHLEKGTLSPFSRRRIVDRHGDFPAETEAQKDQTNTVKGEKHQKDDEERQNGGVMLTTSEIIDLAHGEDSSTGQ